jgi:hypothetical protein
MAAPYVEQARPLPDSEEIDPCATLLYAGEVAADYEQFYEHIGHRLTARTDGDPDPQGDETIAFVCDEDAAVLARLSPGLERGPDADPRVRPREHGRLRAPGAGGDA